MWYLYVLNLIRWNKFGLLTRDKEKLTSEVRITRKGDTTLWIQLYSIDMYVSLCVYEYRNAEYHQWCKKF